ncbi:hypothetical protein SKAU_G00139450 [Synaphobranchus kaupii]|uniref:Uncharacterized protein n=1 Tax=Synaphobranchus kaupii TaxID=118154 RepID=A0A9Q1FSE1_SYNKA|nr:hypothetical protein SKAU_G00139450 [Synaphobranchus kaupii]
MLIVISWFSAWWWRKYIELHDVHTGRTTVLRVLPILLRDKDLGFFRTSLLDDPEAHLADTPVALLTVVRDNITDPIHYHPVNVSVVAEDEVVTSHSQLPDASFLFGLIYALHLNYPRGLTSTFKFVQKVLLGLEDGKLSPRLQTLKNELMM